MFYLCGIPIMHHAQFISFYVQCVIDNVCNFYFCIIVNLSILAHTAIPVSTQSDVDPVCVPQRTIALSTECDVDPRSVP